MLKFTSYQILLITAAMTLSTASYAVDWTGGASTSAWEDSGNWAGEVLPVSYSSNADGEAKINMTTAVNLNSYQKIKMLRVGVGHSARGTLNLLSGANLDATTGNQNTRVGAGRGSEGQLTQMGGVAQYHILQIGLDEDAYGSYNLNGGAVVVTREFGGISLNVGDNGTGNFTISNDAELFTRGGVRLGTDSTGIGCFTVIGSQAKIGIGSEDTVDGCWIQKGGSRLKARVDEGGISMIYIDDFDDDGKGGDVIFEAGSLLDVGFEGAPLAGRWVLMEWRGKNVNYGLAFAPGVDTSIWDFELIETSNGGQLRIVARP